MTPRRAVPAPPEPPPNRTFRDGDTKEKPLVFGLDYEQTKHLTMRFVTIGRERRLAIDPPGVLLTEVYAIQSYPFACKPKPRMTHLSRWRHQEYFAWVESVRVLSAGLPMHERVDVVLVVRGGLRSNADLSNAYKAVEDALRWIAYPDDNVKHIRRQVSYYEDAEEPSFTVILGR